MSASKDFHLEPRPTLSMNPQKFALWLFIVSVTMIFASLTSAYSVRQSQGNFLTIEVPNIFWVNTGIILLSSLTMQIAYYAAKKDKLDLLKVFIGATTVLGVAFTYLQFYAWEILVDMDQYFSGNNPASSFLYVFTGLHALHLISGLIFLLVVLVRSFNSKIHSKKLNTIEMCTNYWHFLDGLWIYLFVFLLLNQ